MDDDLQVADTATVVLSGEPTAAQYVPPPQAYIVLSALYGAFVAVAFGLFVWRRNLEPIRARGVLLSGMSTLYGVTHFFVLAYLVDPSTDNVCSLANLKFFFSTMYLPLWATPMLVRGAALVYKAMLNRAKTASNRSTTWLHWLHPFLGKTRGQVGIVAFIALLMLVIAYATQDYGDPSVPGSCPLSVTLDVDAAFGVLDLIGLIIIASSGYIANVDDIYMIKREMTAQMFVCTSVFILWVVAMFNYLDFYPGNFVMLSAFMATCITIVYPVILTYSAYWKAFNKNLQLTKPSSMHSSEDHEMRLNDSVGSDARSSFTATSVDGLIADLNPAAVAAAQIAKPTLESIDSDKHLRLIDYLRNPEFMGEFKRFCMRAFCAETVTFFVDMQQRDQIARMDTEARTVECKRIYETYIREGSLLELNLTDPVRSAIQAAHKKCPDDIGVFDQALKDMYWLMKTNLFPAWKQDAGFLKLRLKLINTGEWTGDARVLSKKSFGGSNPNISSNKDGSGELNLGAIELAALKAGSSGVAINIAGAADSIEPEVNDEAAA